METKYRITTNQELTGKYKLPRPLPTATEIDDDDTKLLSEFQYVEKIEFLDEGEIIETMYGRIDDPVFACKVLHKGVERDVLYRPIEDVMGILEL